MKKLFGLVKKVLGIEKRRYEHQKKVLASGTPEQRQQLAAREDTTSEALYFMARDADVAVRLAVAKNKSTPVQASPMLAKDQSVDVRMALAGRLVDLLPNLSPEKHGQLYAYAVQALNVLAQDEVVKIRQALSSALKDQIKAPPKVVGQLARDVEREVSEPILRFCVALSDDDLLEIIANHPADWVVSAIAARSAIEHDVTDAVVETKDIPANSVLIRNRGAKFAEGTLQKIIDLAHDYPDWHEVIALRKELSLDLARKLAGFVSESVLGVMERRTDFDTATRKEIAGIVKHRIEFYGQGEAAQETAEGKLDRFIKAGKLTPGVIQDALAWHDHKFVLLALVHLSHVNTKIAEKMLHSGGAKPIVALCWKAGLPMRVALELQRTYARLQPKDIIYAKGGTDYPLTVDELKWQLEFFGVDVSAL